MEFGWNVWSFGKLTIARSRAGNCSKCKKPIKFGEKYRPSSAGRGTTAHYCPTCVGFISSRYHKVKLSNLSPAELDWKLFYDTEIRARVWGIDTAISTGV